MGEKLAIALQATAAAAELLRSEFLSDARITDIQGKDIKTQADRAAQERILAVLGPTGIPVMAEEGDQQNVDPGGLIWLVDPLDGTLNFSRGFAMAAISVALWDLGTPVLGVIHDIFNSTVYTGEVGKGAWVDTQKMCISETDNVAQAVLATGFPSGRSYETDSLLRFVRSVQVYKKVRMLGSAALMLAQVAAGHFDVYEEEDLYFWDVAAGLALVAAAGGRYDMRPGSGPNKYDVRATNGRL